MAFCRKMHHEVRPKIGKNIFHFCAIDDIGAYKRVARIV